MKDTGGKVLSQARRADRYYSAFVRVSGYSWAIALLSGGVALGLWKIFHPHKHILHHDKHPETPPTPQGTK